MEAGWQNVKQVAADELRRFKAGGLRLAGVAVVLVLEVDAVVFESQ